MKNIEWWKLLLLICTCFEYTGGVARDSRLVCYYTLPKKGWPMLSPSFLDATICTHIIVGFATANGGVLDFSQSQKEISHELLFLKFDNPELKLMLSVGGGGADGFAEMAGNGTLRKRFVSEVVQTVQDLFFDGIDIDWEFPALGRPFKERFDFIDLLKDLRESTTEASLILSVAVAPEKWIVDHSYRVPDIARLVDFVNLMGYDFHAYTWYYPATGLNAPLFRRQKERYIAATLNTEWAALYWLRLGVPKEKLVVGVPTYGITFTLASADRNGIGAPALGIGRLWADGQVPYPIVCEFLKNNATRSWEPQARVPYAYRGDQWVSYDDTESLREKARWIKEGDFGGVMVFDLNCDDYNFLCGDERFPLIKAIRSELDG